MRGETKRLIDWAAMRAGIWLTSIPSALLVAVGSMLLADLPPGQTAGVFLLTLWLKVYIRKES